MSSLKQRKEQLTDFFENLNEVLKNNGPENELLLKEDVTVDIKFTGEHGGKWTIKVVEKAGMVIYAPLDESGKENAVPADCTITSDLKTIDKLANGETKPATAFLKRKLKYSGSLKVFRSLRKPMMVAAKVTVEAYGGIENFGTAASDYFNLDKSDTVTSASSESSETWVERLTFLSRSHEEWESDNSSFRCNVCKTKFGFLLRRHHCRMCGKLTCGSCSSHQVLGRRVCSICFQTKIAVSPLDFAGSLPNGDSKLSIPETKGVEIKQPTRTEPERFLDRLKQQQKEPIHAASVDTKTSALLQNSRAMLLKLRGLEKKLKEFTPESIRQRIQATISNLIPRLLFFLPIVWSWNKVISEGQFHLDPDNLSNVESIPSIKFLFAMSVLISTSGSLKVSLLGFVTSLFLSSSPGTFNTLAAWKTLLTDDSLNRFYTYMSSEELLRLLGLMGLITRKVFVSRYISAPILLVVSLVLTLLHRFFSRLLKIYSQAGFVIFSYLGVKIVCKRFLRLSDPQTNIMYKKLDHYLAPITCNQILRLRSVFVKFGQYLGSRADIVPPEWNSVLEKLQDDMPADSPSYVKSIIEKEFQSEFWDIFEAFDFTPVASASVAQVHIGTLRSATGGDGLKVAVKVQHEGICDIMASDMVAFRRVIAFIAWLNPAFGASKTILRAWQKEMLKELDFHNEADNIRTVRRNLRKAGMISDDDYDYADSMYEGSQVIVPRVVNSFVSKSVFCMTYVAGFKITDEEQLSLFGVDRHALMKKIVQAYSIQLYVDGLFNADPHAGNLMVSISDDGSARPVLLDFGMVVNLPQEQRVGYAKLVHSLSQLTISGVSEAIAMVGYENSQSKIHPERDMEFFAHLMRDTGDRKSQRRGQKAFRQRRKAQRKEDKEDDENSEGRFFKQFPESLIFLFRVLGLIRGLCTSLDVPLSYLDIMGEYARLSMLYNDSALVTPVQKRLTSKISNESSFSPREVCLENKIRKLLEDAVSEPNGDTVGVQVNCILRGSVVVDVASGVLGNTNLQEIESNTLFPLLDMSNILPTYALLVLVDRKSIELHEKISTYWPKFSNKAATIENLLNHSQCINDTIKPTTSVFGLTNLEQLENLVKEAKENGDDSGLATFKLHTFAAIVSGIVSSVTKKTLESFISDEFLDQSLGSEIALIANKRNNAALNIAAASNSFAGMVREMLMSKTMDDDQGNDIPERDHITSNNNISTGNDYVDNVNKATSDIKIKSNENESASVAKSSENTNSIHSSKLSTSNHQDQPEDDDVDTSTSGMEGMAFSSLPASVAIDPLMCNSKALKDNYIPSYGCFASARALNQLSCNVIEKILTNNFRSKLLKYKDICTETNPLFGKRKWGLGLQVYDLLGPEKGDKRVFVYAPFGGSLFITCPEKRLYLTITINSLTLDRLLAKKVVQMILKELSVTNNVNPLFQGMF